MSMKEHSTFLKSSRTKASSSDGIMSKSGHSVWGGRVWPLCSDAVDVFYSPNWLGWVNRLSLTETKISSIEVLTFFNPTHPHTPTHKSIYLWQFLYWFQTYISIYLSIYDSFCTDFRHTYLSIYLWQFLYWFQTHISIYLSIYDSFCTDFRHTYLSIYISIYDSFCTDFRHTYLSIYLSMTVFVLISDIHIYLSIYDSFCTDFRPTYLSIYLWQFLYWYQIMVLWLTKFNNIDFSITFVAAFIYC